VNELELSRETYLRVTNILYPFSGLKDIDQAVVDNAARRGTLVHLICEAIVSGFGDCGNDEETEPYIESFMHWFNTNPEIIVMEERFFDDDLKITGKCDFIIKTPEGLCVVDLKTSYQESKTWPVQGNAYAYLASKHGHDIKKIQFIHLSRRGEPPKTIEYPVDHSLFLDTYRVYKHFYEKKNGKTKRQNARETECL